MSLCSTTIFGSDFPADYQSPENEFSKFDSGFSLDEFFILTNEAVSLPCADSVIKIDVGLLQDMKLTTTTTTTNLSKRKWSESNDIVEVVPSNKKQCNGNSNKPEMAPYKLSSLYFDIDIPIEYLVNLVDESLQTIDYCVVDYDAVKFIWTVTIMGCSDFCHGKIQLYELCQFGQSGFIVEANLISGDQSLFQTMFDNLSEHVQNISYARCSFTSDDEFVIFPRVTEMPCKEKILAVCNSLLKSSLLPSGEVDETQILQNVTFLCAAFDTLSQAPIVKTSLDHSYLLSALVRTTESFASVAEDLCTISSTARWVLVYTLRCILTLMDIDARCLTDLRSPGYKTFRNWLTQQQQKQQQQEDLPCLTVASLQEFQLFETMVNSLLSSLSVAAVPSLQISVADMGNYPFKQTVNSAASSLRLVENRYHCCTDVVTTPVRGISCSG